MTARRSLAFLASFLAPVLFGACGGDGGNGGTDVPIPSAMQKTAGDNQSGPPGTALPQPLEVKVTDDQGRAVPDFTVSFSTTGGSVSPQSMDTGTDGRARTTLTLPTSGGTVTVTASGTGVPSVSFTAESVPQQLGFVTAALPAGRRPVAYNYAVEATGGAGDHTFQVSEGSLPAGVTLGSSGTFSGAPTENGSFTFTVDLSDEEGTSLQRSFTIEICDAPDELEPGSSVLLAPSSVGDCGLWLPNDEGDRYYRVAVIRTNRTGQTGGEREVTLTVSGNGVTATAAPPPLLRAPAPSRRPARLPARFAEMAAKLETTRRVHARLLREGEELLRRLGPDAVVRPAAHAEGAPARIDLPAKLRIDVGNQCQVGPMVTALKIVEDDRIAVYQDSTQNATVSTAVTEAQGQMILDYYRDYGEEIIETYFGGVSDVDGNGKVIVFVTPEAADRVLAYVWPGDLFSQSSCGGSNEAELVYMGVEEVLALTDGGLSLTLGTTVHEIEHISAAWERLQADESGSHPLWLSEGAAEIASTRAARLAWEAAGGPDLTERVGSDTWFTPPTQDDQPYVTSENFALLFQLFRVQAAMAEQPNSILTNTGDDADVYGSGWMFLRWLGDAYGEAGTARHADAELFRTLINRSTPVGVNGIEAAAGADWETLLEDFVAAAMYNGTGVEDEAPRTYTSWNFISGIELWCFAVDPRGFDASGCPAGSGPGAPGAFPWPVTTDSQGASPDVSLGQAQTVSLASALYQGDAGQGGFRVHDFLTNGTGRGAEINVSVQAPAKVVAVRLR